MKTIGNFSNMHVVDSPLEDMLIYWCIVIIIIVLFILTVDINLLNFNINIFKYLIYAYLYCPEYVYVH